MNAQAAKDSAARRPYSRRKTVFGVALVLFVVVVLVTLLLCRFRTEYEIGRASCRERV